jgi:hypothetical protein
MSLESVVEAFARGLAQGFAGVSAMPPRQTAGKRRSARPSQRSSAAPPPVPETIYATPEIIAPPVTQAELERMERALRGEGPTDSYVPSEGVAPWQGS